MIPDKKVASRSTRTAGRPRSEQAKTALLKAAYSFLQNQPVASISTLHIAREAGVSTATLYRWWPTKEALLLDAFLCKSTPAIVLSSEGPPLERIRSYLHQTARFLKGAHGIVVARMLTAIQDNPALRDQFLDRVYSPRSKELRAAVKDAIQAGDLPPATNIDDFLDMLFGPIIVRLLIQFIPIRESFVLSVFEHAVMGARRIAKQEK